MAKVETKKLAKRVLNEDKIALDNLQSIANFAPANKDYEIAKGIALYKAQDASETKENLAKTAFKSARDGTRKNQWSFHNWMLGAKKQIAAQFGDDSDEYQSLGLIKKSEKKRPVRKKKGPDSDAK